MYARYKLMTFFLCIVIIALTACSTLPPTSNTSPISSATSLPPSGSHHKLFVFLSGFTSSLSTTDALNNGGYGSDPDFFSPGHIQPFLQLKFPGSYFLTYSYQGFSSEGKPSTYTCALTTDSFIADLATGLYNQISQFMRSHVNTPNIDTYVIGHSLGGVIAFAFLSQMVSGKNMLNTFPNGGSLKGVFTLDSPIGGVTNNWLYSLFGARYAVMKANCNGANLLTLPMVGQLNDLFHSASSGESLGATASVSASLTGLGNEDNQAIAMTAMKDGLTVSTFGNDVDVLWQPSLCNVHLADFLSTQWLQEVQGGRNPQGGAVYARKFSAGTLDCNALSNKDDAGNHFDVLTNSDVQTAIWQVIIGQDPNALQSIPIISPPTVTPIPVPTPTPDPIATTGTTGTPTPTVTSSLTPTPSPTPTPTQTPTPSPAPSPSPTPIPSLSVFVGSSDKYVYALNASDGSLEWRYQTGGQVTSSPAVVNGALFVGSDDGYIYALNAMNGSLLWRYQTGGQVQSSPDIINGVLYIGSHISQSQEEIL